MKKIFTSFLLICSLSLFSQTVYYVKTSGNDSYSGTNWANAFKTLQKALSVAVSGEIWVGEGVYYPDDGYEQDNMNRSFHLKDNVSIYGGFAGNEYSRDNRDWKKHLTILSGDIDSVAGYGGNSYHVLVGDRINNSAVLDGFTIRDGNANGNIGLHSDAGGGMYNYAASPLIRNCIFRNNFSNIRSNTFGGGAVCNYWNSNPKFINCSFIDNATNLYGGAVFNYYSSPTFVNCIFSGNRASYGGAVCAEHNCTASFINCTFYDNKAPDGAALYTIYYGNMNLVNSIIWSHTNWFGKEDIYFNYPAVIYSIVEGGYAGTGNLSIYPMFTDTASNDFHLLEGSPAIDAGTPSYAPLYDVENYVRPAIFGYDIGAHEYYSPVIYVRHDAAGVGNNGTSWYNAFLKLQDALKFAETYPIPVSILVAKGTYYPDEGVGITNDDRSASFNLHNNVKLIGGFSGYDEPAPLPRQATILSGNIERFEGTEANSYHVVNAFNVDSTAVLDGFVIEDGNANAPDHFNGGGILNRGSWATIANCIIRNNLAASGGGGMANLSSSFVKIINTVFYNNSSASWGGGLYNYNAVPGIINCTFYANTAVQGGAIGNINVSPSISNSIIWGNSSGIYNLSGAAMVNYSIVQGGYSGTGNLDADPMFLNPSTGDLHLKVNSPAIDTGSNFYAVAGKDLDGQFRIMGTRVDLGAYEFKPGIPIGSGVFLIHCPANFSVNSHPNACAAQVDFTGDHAATLTGGKGIVQIQYTPVSGTWLPVGVNTVNIMATDEDGRTRTCSMQVTVVDSTPPEIRYFGASPQVLWPPNHKMREVHYSYRRRDNCNDATDTIIITSNEPVMTPGLDNTSPDWEIDSYDLLKLRAERVGAGEGRIYTITLVVRDAAGNTATANATVTVPHDNSEPAAPIADIMDQPAPVDFGVRVMPNPTRNYFTLLCQSSSAEAIYIRVMDNTGRVLDRRTIIKGSGIISLGGDYLPGIYYAEVVQGANWQTVKLVKR